MIDKKSEVISRVLCSLLETKDFNFFLVIVGDAFFHVYCSNTVTQKESFETKIIHEPFFGLMRFEFCDDCEEESFLRICRLIHTSGADMEFHDIKEKLKFDNF